MTATIDMDSKWLKEQIEMGIGSFLECEKDYLSGLLMKYIYEQLFISGCAINGRFESGSETVLTISIPIPDPEKCAEYIENMRRVSILTEHRFLGIVSF